MSQLYSERDTTFVLRPHIPLQANGALMKSVGLSLSGNAQPTWVEGIGSLSAPVLNVSAYREGELEELRCCWVGADTLYRNLGDMRYIREQVCEGLHCMKRKPGETYVPLVEEGKSWVVAHFTTYANQVADDVESLTAYRLEGDTVISDIGCMKLMCSHTDLTTGATTTDYIASLFEDGRRVMFFPPGMDKPHQMYDFYATAGDTIDHYDCESQAWQTPSPERFARSERDIVIGHCDEMYDGIRQNTCYYYSAKHKYYGIWLKGIGDTQGPTHVGPSDSRNVLLRCSVGDRILYRDTRFDIVIDGIKDIEHSIGSHNGKRDDDIRYLYDLTGRRLAAPPAHGLYIEDGKVRSR